MPKGKKREALRRMVEIAYRCLESNCEDNGATQKEIKQIWLESEERKELRSLYRKVMRA